MKYIHYIALTLVIVGALNWGLVGLFDFNIVTTLFGIHTILTRTVYVLIGLCGVWLISHYPRIDD